MQGEDLAAICTDPKRNGAQSLLALVTLLQFRGGLLGEETAGTGKHLDKSYGLPLSFNPERLHLRGQCATCPFLGQVSMPTR